MKPFHFAVFLISALMLWGCGGSAVIATIGDERISREEFEEIYAKNNGGWDAAMASSVDDRQNFLDLVIKFRLKVKEAKQQGLLSDTAVTNEIDTYRSSVAQSYMLEKELIEPAVRKMYDRKKEEVHASHVLIRVDAKAAPADTLKAWEKAQKVISLLPRVPFDTLARAYSEDPSATFNNGDLGWFSSGRMVEEFEEACYRLKTGEVTPAPVRTQFGYHIIKLTGRQPYRGQAKIQHILRRFDQSLSDTMQQRDTAWMAYRAVKAGMAWSDAVKQFSQDPNTMFRDGEIGTFDRDRLPPQVGEQVWKLEKDSVGEPLGFPYGFHILRAADFLGVPPYAEAEKDLKQTYQAQRYANDHSKFVQRLIQTYGLQFDVPAVEKLKNTLDSSKTANDSTWSASITDSFVNAALYTYRGGSLTVADFIKRVNDAAEFRTYLLAPSNIEMMLKRMVEVDALAAHGKGIPQRFPTFAKLMDEYQDGILLYRVEQDEVWKKVVVNDSLLRLHHDSTKAQYRWPDRVNFAEVYVTSDSALKEVKWKLAYGDEFTDVAFDYTARAGYKEKNGVWGFQPYTANDLSQRASTMAVDSVSEPFRYQSGWSIIKVLAKESPRMKTFEEAGPEVASGYQELASKRRELEWMESLKRKFPVTTNQEVLAGTFKKK